MNSAAAARPGVGVGTLRSAFRLSTSCLAGVVTASAGSAVLVGWWLDITSLKSVLPGIATMKANTAVGFVLAGVSLVVAGHVARLAWVRRVAQACAGAMALLGLLTLSQYLLGLDFGIDQLLFREPVGAVGTLSPGRMPPMTAVSFLVLGCALVLSGYRPTILAAQGCALLTVLTGVLPLIGYLYGAAMLIGFGHHTQMAVHTAELFVVMGVGVLFLHSAEGLMKMPTSRTHGGWLVRNAVPFVIGMPLMLGWLRVEGEQHGYFDTRLGVAIVMTILMVLLTGLVWWAARALNRLDAIRRQAEAALRTSETRYRRIFECAKDGILILDADTGMIADVNPSLTDLLGYTHAEFLGRHLWEIGLFKDVEALKDAFLELQAKDSVRRESLPLETRNGRRIEVEFVSNVYPVDTCMMVQCNIRDVTDHWRAKELEEAAHVETRRRLAAVEQSRRAMLSTLEDRKQAEKHEARLKQQQELILSSVAEGILEMDMQGNHTFTNQAAARMLGYKAEELVGRSCHSTWHYLKRDGSPCPEDECQIYATCRDALAHHVADDMFSRKDGSTFPVEYTSTPICEEGRLTGVVVAFADITGRKQDEAALRASEGRYRTLFEHSADGILIVDLETKALTHANPAMCRMLGYTGEELETLGVADIHPKDAWPHVMPQFEAQARGDKSLATNLPCLRKDGTVFPADVNATTVAIDRRQCMVGFFRDITDHVREQKALELANDTLSRRNAELRGFYHTVSHELKTPLTSAREFASILLDGIAGPLTDSQKRYLLLIRESCDLLQFCVSDLTEATRLDTGKLELQSADASVEALVANVVAAMTSAMQAKGIDLRREIEPALANVLLDARRITQVCMNLLGNALKFTAAGGAVTVRAGTDPDTPDSIRFSVSDTGRGIAPEHLDRIFDKLYQVKETDTTIVGGMGLGLYIASGIVRLHGGRMWVESTVGHGSTFFFSIPTHARAPRQHVLFVDDDLSAQKMVGAVLENAGITFSFASDGETALKMVEGHSVDLAIVDLCLPGMPGPVLMRELRDRWSGLPLLLYTAYPDSQLMAQALEVTPLTVLIKTCPVEKLLATVRGLLEARASSSLMTRDHDRNVISLKGEANEENTDC